MMIRRFFHFLFLSALLWAACPPISARAADGSGYLAVVYDPPPGRQGAAPREFRRLGAVQSLQSAPAAVPAPAPGQMFYAVLPTLVVIYPSTAAGSLSPAALEQIQANVSATARFWFTQSRFRLWVDVTFLVIPDYKDLSEFTRHANGGYWLDPFDGDGDGISVEADLLQRGVVEGRYASVNYLWAHNNGTLPPAYGGLGGLMEWGPGFTGITANPIFEAGGEDLFCGAFPHEFQHTLDFMLELSGLPDYFHADRPWELAGAFGENWSFWQYGMKIWPEQGWLSIHSRWASLAQAPDQDNDGFPDEGAALPVTEQVLGTSPALVDSDSDGLPDREEAAAGLFRRADPTHPDSDGDGAPDGRDFEPLHPVGETIPGQTPPLDGSPAGWNLLTGEMDASPLPWASAPLEAQVYAAWDPDYLYLMVRVDRFAAIGMMLDASADGWFHGRDNYEIWLDPSYPSPQHPAIVGSARLFDSSAALIAARGYPMWDDDPTYPFDRLARPGDIRRYARPEGDGYLVQIAIPIDPRTGAALAHERRVGLNLVFRDVERQWGRQARVFEVDEFAYFTLWEGDAWPAGFCDGFDLPWLDGRWQEFNPEGEVRYSLTAHPGALRLAAGGMLQPAGLRFNVQTQVSVPPGEQAGQGAGLLVWQDADDWLRLELTPSGLVRLTKRVDGVEASGGEWAAGTAALYLKISREREQFSAWYSLDGHFWQPAGAVWMNAPASARVGVQAVGAGDAETWFADFDNLEFDWCAPPPAAGKVGGPYYSYLPALLIP